MSYIGNDNITQGFIPAIDYFSGNGSTVAFTLSRPVASVAQVQANISNVPQNPSSAFSVSGNTITFTSAPPSGTNNIYVYYTSPITQVIAPSQGTVTTTSLAGGTISTTADITSNGLTVGRGAGAVSTNTAVGASALAANTTGAYNNAFGYEALTSVTTGNYNAAFGGRALKSATTSDWNAGFGTLALYLNTTGANNTAAGSQALYNNTTASNNTAVGYQAGYTNSTGASNVFLGYAAGYASTNGLNTFAGYASGTAVTTGTNNSFYGYTAGYLVTTGSNNTIIGSYSGNNSGLDIRTASNYIVLSDGAGNPRMRMNGFGLYCPEVYSVTGAAAANVYVDGSGNLYRATSSLKYKTDVQDAEHGLVDVMKLRSVTYKSKKESENTIKFGGLIAEEVHEAGLTEFVQYAEDGSPDALAYGNMVSLCIKAIQEQQAIIQTLTDRITALENK